MKGITIAAATLLAAAAIPASAQMYYGRAPDPYVARGADQECWNPHASHFERVRPGEIQGDLDFGHCRVVGYGDRYDRSYDRRDWRDRREECWNPRAGHYEEVRRGDRQDDLDFSRCRIER
jgi:hypothetical protein